MKRQILIAGEESQVICGAFRRAGFEAYSCDLVPTRGNPEWHLQQDMLVAIASRHWDLIIMHPDCCFLAVSGNRWYGAGMIHNDKRIAAIEWTVNLWGLAKKHSDHCALENPVSVIWQYLDAPVCYLQPWEHGHGETKKTGFALHNLNPLLPSNIVDGRENRVWKMAPNPNRKRDRSATLPGVGAAIVFQWGPML